ncbi:MAG: hypothetical protein ACRDHI_02990 [Actinomycetota bacterium]
MPTRTFAAATLTAIALTACTTSALDPPAPTPPALSAGAATELGRIEGLAIEQPAWKADGSNWSLTLSWREPEGFQVDHYRVVRDGVTVAGHVSGTTFRDDGARPGTRYSYRVSGVGPAGKPTRPDVERVKTGQPPLSEARLEGTFALRMVVESASGTQNPVRGGAISHTFEPRCGKGACSVRWSMRTARANGLLRRDGAVYAARLSTPLFIRSCFGRAVDEAIDVRLRVSAAAAYRHAWRATKVRGRIGEVSSFKGCQAAAIVWNVRGALQV